MARGGARAAPPGRAQLRGVTERLAREGWPAGLTVLTGEDLFHLEAAERAILDALVPPGSDPFTLTVFAGEPTPAHEILAAARSAGMFSPRRVVLVRDVSAIAADEARVDAACEAFGEYARRPPPDSHVLVRAPRLDVRRKLHKMLAGVPQALAFGPPRDRADLQDELRDMARVRGVRIEPQAAEALLDACAGDLHRVRAELDKLQAWLEGEADRRVTVDVVREVVAAGGLLTGWEVADAVSDRDGPAALAAARRLLDAGEEPLRLLGGLAYRLRGMLQARALLEAGGGPREALAAARVWGVGADRFLAGLRRFTLDDLRAAPAALLAADRALKSRALDPRAVLESTLEQVVGVAAPGGRT